MIRLTKMFQSTQNVTIYSASNRQIIYVLVNYSFRSVVFFFSRLFAVVAPLLMHTFFSCCFISLSGETKTTLSNNKKTTKR